MRSCLIGMPGHVAEPGIDPPAQSTDQIEIKCALYPEARLIHAPREALPGVSARVSKLSIEGSEQLLESRHQDDGAASRLQHACHASERFHVVADVLEDVQRDDRIQLVPLIPIRRRNSPAGRGARWQHWVGLANLDWRISR